MMIQNLHYKEKKYFCSKSLRELQRQKAAFNPAQNYLEKRGLCYTSYSESEIFKIIQSFPKAKRRFGYAKTFFIEETEKTISEQQINDLVVC